MLDQEEANWPPASYVVNDPGNGLSLPLSDSYQPLYGAIVSGLVAVGLWGAISAVDWGIRPLSILVVLGAVGAFRLAVNGLVLARRAELRPTPVGFVVRGRRTDWAVSWIDISYFFVRDMGT